MSDFCTKPFFSSVWTPSECPPVQFNSDTFLPGVCLRVHSLMAQSYKADATSDPKCKSTLSPVLWTDYKLEVPMTSSLGLIIC